MFILWLKKPSAPLVWEARVLAKMHIFFFFFLHLTQGPTWQVSNCLPAVVTPDFLRFCNYHTDSHLRTFTYAIFSNQTEPLLYLSIYLLEPTQATPALWSSLWETPPDWINHPSFYATEVHTSPITDILLDCNSLFIYLFPHWTVHCFRAGSVSYLLGPSEDQHHAWHLVRCEANMAKTFHLSAHQSWYVWSEWSWGCPLPSLLLLPSPLSNGMIPDRQGHYR